MTARDRLRHLSHRDDVLQVVLIFPHDYEAYGLTESYKIQMDSHARVCSYGGHITVLDPQTLISSTSGFVLEREYLDLGTSIPTYGASPAETGGPASAKNPEIPFAKLQHSCRRERSSWRKRRRRIP